MTVNGRQPHKQRKRTRVYNNFLKAEFTQIVLYFLSVYLTMKMTVGRLLLPIMLMNVGLIGSYRVFGYSLVPLGSRYLSRKVPTIAVTSKDALSVVPMSASSEVDPGSVPGTLLKILKYPHPKLRTKNEPVEIFDESLAQTAKEMLLVMYAAKGVGLAAPQLGINQRIMVFNEKSGSRNKKTEKENEKVLINPTITAKSADMKVGEEACLSFPRVEGDVVRHSWVKVSYQDLTGTQKEARFEGWLGVIFQHEYDHLDGVLLVDRLVPKAKEQVEHTLERLVRKYGPGGAV